MVVYRRVGTGVDGTKHKGIFWGGGDILYLDQNLGHTDICICQKSANVQLTFVHFILPTGKLNQKKLNLCILKYVGESILMSTIYSEMLKKKIR